MSIKKYKKTGAAAWIASLSAMLPASGAGAVSMQELFDGDSIVVGDVTFTDWQLDPGGDASPGFEPDFNLIEVEPIQSGSVVGLRYMANDQWSVVDDNFIDTFFSYSVTTGPSPAVGSELELTDIDFLGDGGTIDVTEEQSDGLGNFLGLTAVFSDNLNLDAQLLDSVSFTPPAFELFVETSVLIAGDFLDDEVLLNAFEQRLNLDVVADGAVPEPATVGLFALATATALTTVNRRRRGSS